MQNKSPKQQLIFLLSQPLSENKAYHHLRVNYCAKLHNKILVNNIRSAHYRPDPPLILCIPTSSSPLASSHTRRTHLHSTSMIHTISTYTPPRHLYVAASRAQTAKKAATRVRASSQVRSSEARCVGLRAFT